MKKHLLWLIPGGILALLLALLLALPGFVSSAAHRHTIERFASNLTGRQVSIAGNLSLSLLPRPEISATRITITGPNNEIITAKALALDISLPALLHGQLAVQVLNLDSPSITFPWPLPNGPRAVAPPPWLAALHAHLNNATLHFGAAEFTGVSADIFTGQNGAVSVSGNGAVEGLPLTLSLALGQLAPDGTSPLSVQASGMGASGKISGTLNSESTLTGKLSLTLPHSITGTAALTANGDSLTISNLSLRQGGTTLTGTATLGFSPTAITANLVGQNLNLDALLAQTPPPLTLPVSLNLTASNVTLGGHVFPSLRTDLSTGPAGVKISALSLGLPGGGGVTGTLAFPPGGALSGQASLTAPDLPALFTAYTLPAPPESWRSAKLTASLSGTASQPVLRDLSGTLGTDHLTGSLILAPGHAAGQLAFDHLALAPLSAWLMQLPGSGFTADGEITVAHAEAGPVKLQNLALDAELDGTLNIRRVSAKLYGGLAAGSFTLDASGRVTAAQGFINIPSAIPLAAMLPAGWAPLSPLLTQAGSTSPPRLSLALAAQGPASALATSAVLTLGDFTLTAAPVIDLTHGSASGALSLRHPSAIAAMKLFGLDQGVAFPGPGSIALRANFTASATQWGFNDFVLSFGALTANGRVLVNNNTLSGQIDADTLALPPIPASLPLPGTLPLQGRLSLSANRVLYADTQILGPSTANLDLSNSTATLTLNRASLGDGTLSGSLAAKLSPTALPAFTLKLLAQNVAATAFSLPVAFPYTFPAGTLGATAALTASGYTPKLWAATLAGSATLTATQGRLRGFSLAGLSAALGKPGATRRLLIAANSGTTPFSTLSLSGTFANGNCNITQASLTGPDGNASAASGSGIDIADSALALRLLLSPAVKPPIGIPLVVLGPWSAPKRTAHLKAALAWKHAQ
ncbi:MAG: AsmA family protein [Acidocella sp.]|nr:AsmA family protein [Acidocella sp.]